MLCMSCGPTAVRIGVHSMTSPLPLPLLRRVVSSIGPCSSRSLTGDIDRRDEKPESFHLEHVQQRVAHSVPLMFRERLDYTFYRKDVILDDQIFCVKRSGLDAMRSHLGMIAFVGCFLLPHVEAEAISIHPMIDDGTVRVRWRVKYVSFLKLALDPKMFKRNYRVQNLSWFDGYSVLTVDGNGDVHNVTLQRTQVDEERGLLKDSTKKIAAKIGVLPGANASFQRVRRPDERDGRSDNH